MARPGGTARAQKAPRAAWPRGRPAASEPAGKAGSTDNPQLGSERWARSPGPGSLSGVLTVRGRPSRVVPGSAYQARSSRRETRRLRSSCRCRSAHESRASRSSATSLERTHQRLSTLASLGPRSLPPPPAARDPPARAAGKQHEGGSRSSRSAAAAKSRPFRPRRSPLPAGLPNPEPRVQGPPYPMKIPPQGVPRPAGSKE